MPRIVIPTAENVIQADNERVDQALWLALCELGPEPDFKKDRRAHLAYVRQIRERARQIAGRLN